MESDYRVYRPSRRKSALVGALLSGPLTFVALGFGLWPIKRADWPALVAGSLCVAVLGALPGLIRSQDDDLVVMRNAIAGPNGRGNRVTIPFDDLDRARSVRRTLLDHVLFRNVIHGSGRSRVVIDRTRFVNSDLDEVLMRIGVADTPVGVNA